MKSSLIQRVRGVLNSTSIHHMKIRKIKNYLKLIPSWKIDWPQDHAVDNVYNDVYMTSLYSLNLVNVVIYIKKYFWNYNLYENYTIYGLVTKNGPQQRDQAESNILFLLQKYILKRRYTKITFLKKQQKSNFVASKTSFKKKMMLLSN